MNTTITNSPQSLKATLTSCILAIMLLFPALMMGQKYTSLIDGNWNNTTTLWSLNGATPCGCTPGTSVNGVIVLVNHNVSMNYDVNIINGGSLTISSTGLLNGTGFNLTVNDGGFSISANGEADLLSLNLDLWTGLNVFGTLVIVNGDLDAAGFLTFDGASVGITNGDMNINAGGVASIMNSSFLSILNGDINNYGDIWFSNSCLSATNGNLNNTGSGAIVGSGGISVTGDINNLNLWGANVDWCAGGVGTGLPHAENCGTNPCGTFLPVEYAYIRSDVQENFSVELEWQTVTETNNQQFNVQRSTDGRSYETIGTVYPDVSKNYSFNDSQAPQGTVHYRIEQVDIEGAQNISQVVTVKVEGFEEAFSAYPNPFASQVQLSFQGKPGSSADIVITDLNGRVVLRDNVELENYAQTREIGTNELGTGMYILTVVQSNVKYQVKLVKL